MSSPLLKVEGLKVSFGHVEAVKGIDFQLHEGQITTLVGANGAGKSTTLLALSGLVKKTAGRVSFSPVLMRRSGRPLCSPGSDRCASPHAATTTISRFGHVCRAAESSARGSIARSMLRIRMETSGASMFTIPSYAARGSTRGSLEAQCSWARVSARRRRVVPHVRHSRCADSPCRTG